MLIEIEDLKFQCIIGILDFEREKVQDVIVTLSLKYVFCNNFIDYSLVAKMVQNNMLEEKYQLIEDALADISKKIKKEFSQTSELFIKITKPSILATCRVSVSESYKFKT